jgi:hypothetical protein
MTLASSVHPASRSTFLVHTRQHSYATTCRNSGDFVLMGLAMKQGMRGGCGSSCVYLALPALRVANSHVVIMVSPLLAPHAVMLKSS